MQHIKTLGRVGRKIGSGRTLNAALKLKILRIVENNPSLSCRQIAARLGNVVFDETIRLYLKNQDFLWKKRSRIPNLSEKDKRERVKFAESHMEIELSLYFSQTNAHLI